MGANVLAAAGLKQIGPRTLGFQNSAFVDMRYSLRGAIAGKAISFAAADEQHIVQISTISTKSAWGAKSSVSFMIGCTIQARGRLKTRPSKAMRCLPLSSVYSDRSRMPILPPPYPAGENIFRPA